MRLKNIELENKYFSWGLDLSEIKSIFDYKEFYENENKYSDNKTLRIKISNQWGINCNSCVFTAPYYDRIINRIEINLGIIDQELDSLMDKLELVFGKRKSDTSGENHGWGSVVRNCTWEFDNCKGGISIYGGKRNRYEESNYGLIYFYLTDIDLIHKLYAADLIAQNKKLEYSLNNNTFSKEVFKLKKSQDNKVFVVEKDEYKGYNSDFIRQANNSYYKRDIMTTPSILSDALMEDEVCIVRDSVNSLIYIANVKHISLIKESSEVKWYNTLPAKGSGSCSIKIDDFSIYDDHSRPETEILIAALEKILQRKIECIVDYNA